MNDRTQPDKIFKNAMRWQQDESLLRDLAYTDNPGEVSGDEFGRVIEELRRRYEAEAQEGRDG